ncbi:Phytochrome-like protein cph2 [Thalassocella blandensis]|nr:Phytochrome-like protein cph2 [Thalassocella blandensis]
MKWRVRWNSVKSKLIGLTIGFFAAGFCLSTIIFFLVGENKSREDFSAEIKRILTFVVEQNVQWQMHSKNQPETQSETQPETQTQVHQRHQHLKHVERSLSSPYFGSISRICLYDAELHLLTAYTRDTYQCDLSGESTSSEVIVFQRHTARLQSPIVERGKVLGYALVEAYYRDASLLNGVFLWLFLLAFCLSLLLAFVLSKKVIKRSLKPLNALYEASKIIARNPLSDVRAIKVSNDEIGRVVDVFNTMLDNFCRENTALVASENRFRSLSENSPVGVYLKSKRGFEYTNHRWSQITGLRSFNAAGFMANIEVKDKAFYQDALSLAKHHRRSQVVEYRYHNPELGRRSLMEYISLIEDEQGKECYIGSLMDVTELKVAQLELEKLAFYDPLTLLPNRRFFKDHLELAIARAQKERKKIAIYMVDLDDFKRVNDCLGHDTGDQLLVDIAKRLKGVLYEGDVVSRLGGDEFMLLLDNIEDPTRLDHASKRILDALRVTVQSTDESLQVVGSVGIAIFPTDAQSPEELLRYADIALYNAKGAGGNRVSYYSCELDRRIKAKVSLEHRLRKALEDNTLEVYLQPQFCAQRRTMVWAEALLRWTDETQGAISPDIFIPLAEETGLILPVGDFVMERVLEMLSLHHERLRQLGIAGIAINLSPKQFFAPDFIANIEEKLNRFAISPSMLEFEITETTVMDDVDTAVALMQRLREKGVKLSIDDFGTGFSSLSHLKKFPITSLKIDKSFIRDIPEDQSDVEISCAIIAMAKKLGLSVVAEGVETLVQADFLAENQCEYLQGFYFAKPMRLEQLLLLNSQ